MLDQLRIPRPIVVLVLLFAGAVAPELHADASQPGPFAAGRRDLVVTRPNGSTFTATVHYPATTAGVNAPFDASGGPYPVLSFGHGFLSAVTLYQSTLAHLASHGYLAIASQSEGGLFPSHSNFANDIRRCLDVLIDANDDPKSPFAGGVAVDRLAVGGHSMGGGCSILAAASDPRVRAVLPLAAADTNPSSIAASAGVHAPMRLIVGSQDSIVPPGPSGGPMFANAPGPRQLLSIAGGFHCGFIDSSIVFCDSGSISRAAQLAIVRALLLEFLDLHLKGDGADPDAWQRVWGPEAPAVAGVDAQIDARVGLSPASVEVPLPRGGVVEVAFTVTNAAALATDLVFAADGLKGVGIAPAAVEALAPGASVELIVTIPASAATEPRSVLLSARRPDGARGYATLLLLPSTGSAADLNGDGLVDGADLAILLSNFGGAGIGDLNGDGVVDGADLAILLGAWSR
jgi:predicted dienelactone hydrolase